MFLVLSFLKNIWHLTNIVMEFNLVTNNNYKLVISLPAVCKFIS